MQIRMLAVCAATTVALLLGVSRSAVADPLVVKTEQGKVQGKTINDGKVRAYLGLPYAAPPVSELRWRAPEAAEKWKGVRDATKFGARCVQGEVFDDMVFQDSGPSEDCLFLNVYVPADATARSKLPVMFWIHGGGYLGGSGSEPRHNGDFLPLKGVVLVTINYRLGVFGFLATNELAQEANGAAGNYGLMDMIAALHWVNANIGGFGGDAKNVTIFGESAGSFAVSTLMASPMARGLFSKVIGESGGAFSGSANPSSKTFAERATEDEAWMAGNGAKTMKELRAMTTEQIAEAAAKEGTPKFSPDIDGRVLTEPIADTYAAGRQAHVPLLSGWNADEDPSLAGDDLTVAQWKSMAQEMFKERADEFLKLYPGDTNAEARRAAIDFGSDSFIAFGTWKWIEAQRKTGDAPVYRYHFELGATPSKFHPGTFAFHSDDIEYVFGTLDTRPEWDVRPEDRRLSEQMMRYWTNFAKTGDPNGRGLPEWPRYGADDALIHLNDPITSGPSTVRARYEFLLQGMPALPE
ncbi:MAG TPA: carboxylesterase family protein [Terracidiphilus sp.]|jgi:para-nitrobenzyl esterase|nr:carboxylesterase family protein [Terracidiphilus sp.]